jgi:ketosteroid isomerase-like protein
MRLLLIGGALAALGLSLAACGGSSKSTSSGQATQKDADLYQIDQIERTWHQAASTKNLDLMMSIWAPNATFTINGKTYTGKAALRKLFSGAGPFQPQNHWLSDTPAYKIRVTVNGDKGTLYFECHYIDTKTGKVAAVVGADQDVQRIDGKWLITNGAAASPTLKP